MANQEHVERLRQGVAVWNSWRVEHREVEPDLSEADLSGADLSGDDNFNHTYFVKVGNELRAADLSGANLGAADLSGANLSAANLDYTYLNEANLSGANLSGTSLDGTELGGADLSFADFSHAKISGANLTGANFHSIRLFSTIFARVNLYLVKGLDTAIHEGPSIVDVKSVIFPQGETLKHFLRGTGFPDNFIDYLPALLATSIQFYSVFISHSNQDQEFSKRLYADLQSKGVRCWFAPENLKIGDHYHQRIDESIRLYDKLILILSEHAIQSTWVEREVMSACEKEDHLRYEVLFPIRLDDAVMQTSKAWAADVRRRWHIGDFTRWKDHDAYQKALDRLLRDLKAGEKP